MISIDNMFSGSPMAAQDPESKEKVNMILIIKKTFNCNLNYNIE